MGAALAFELHKRGHKVYATARNTSKMTLLAAAGITTLELDILSTSNIATVAAQIPALDMLVNNAGAMYSMPTSDTTTEAAKKVFDLNVFAQLEVTRAFLPHLIRAPGGGTLVFHTSVGSHAAIPFQSSYNASKAALAMYSEALRLELQPFDIKVVDLKTAGVKTNIVASAQQHVDKLPEGSIYEPARELVEKALRQEWVEGQGGIQPEQWAKEVADALQKVKPPPTVWCGQSANLVRAATHLPAGSLDGTMSKMVGMQGIEKVLRKH